MTSENNLQKKCGFCGEAIPAKAGRCPYCGSILEVTFDNSYTINQTDTPENNGITGEQTNGQNTGTDAQVPQNTTVGQEYVDYSGENPADGNSRQQTDPNLQVSHNLPTDPNLQAGSDTRPDPNLQAGKNAQNNNSYRPNGNGVYRPDYNYAASPKEPLSNGLKVFLTVLFTILPGIGQLAGIIAAIVFMNSEGDSDRKSFGVALLVASLVMFVVSCIGCFVFILAFSSRMAY